MLLLKVDKYDTGELYQVMYTRVDLFIYMCYCFHVYLCLFPKVMYTES